MPFTAYATLSDVAQAHHIHCRRGEFIEPAAATLSDYFRSELEFTLREVAFDSSEAVACESLIYPLLRELWKPFHQSLTLWSHQPIAYDADLCGVPDYLIARRSPLGAVVFDAPYMLVVEAKRDDFVRGWAQCLAAMRGSQRLNDNPLQTLYGIVTTGQTWQFGRLHHDDFLQEPRLFTLTDLDRLAGAIRFLLLRCHEQAAHAGPAVEEVASTTT